MSENTKYWDRLSRPPETALKSIGAGRLKGKTDINPQWRLEAMTQVFGPCGVGWRYRIDKLWTEPGHGNVVFAFALVSVAIMVGGKWSEEIPGIGGNKLIEEESKGPYSNDEAYKMAVTDALSVALKAVGVAADIYSGLWDGAGYREKEKEPDPEFVAEVQKWKGEISAATTQEELNEIGSKILNTTSPEIQNAVRAAWGARMRVLK